VPSLCIRRQTALASLFHKTCLKPDGFTKYNITWNKPNENGFVYLVSFQNSFGNLAGDCEMTVNLGVFFPILLEDWHRKKIGKYIKTWDCVYPFHQRLGVLAFGKDTWWKMSDEPDELALMLEGLYKDYALDWFKTFSSYESIINWWKSLEEDMQSVIGIGKPMARLLGKLGYKAEAKQLFETVIQRYQYERPNIRSHLITEAHEYGITLDIDNNNEG
jgi:hypothetical protein